LSAKRAGEKYGTMTPLFEIIEAFLITVLMWVFLLFLEDRWNEDLECVNPFPPTCYNERN
jgi:hypothetical protein